MVVLLQDEVDDAGDGVRTVTAELPPVTMSTRSTRSFGMVLTSGDTAL
jgi:hypothetical protein